MDTRTGCAVIQFHSISHPPVTNALHLCDIPGINHLTDGRRSSRLAVTINAPVRIGRYMRKLLLEKGPSDCWRVCREGQQKIGDLPPFSCLERWAPARAGSASFCWPRCCQLSHSRFASFFVKPPVAFARARFFFCQALRTLVMQPLNPSKSLLRFVLQFCWPNHHTSLTPPRPLQLATFLQGRWRAGRHGWGAIAASSHSINSRHSRSARIAGRVMHLFMLSLQQFGRKLPKYANGNSSFTHRRGSKDLHLVIGN